MNDRDLAIARQAAGDIHRALHRWELEGSVWQRKRRELRDQHGDDEFFQALAPVYQQDHDDLHQEVGMTIVRGMATVCRLYGVRFMSISDSDFITFENIYGENRRPVTWEACDLIDRLGLPQVSTEGRIHVRLYGGCGNGAQYQIALRRCMQPSGSWGDIAVPAGLLGCYDIRDGEQRICNGITLRQMLWQGVNAKYTDGDLNEYFVQAGACV